MSNVPIPYRHALVTGASSGIGEAICYALDNCGIERITLVARNKERLERVAASLTCTAQIMCADLTNATDLDAVAKALDGVDLLINNAGIGSFGPFAHVATDQHTDIVRLNCHAPVFLASKALQNMRTDDHGCVVNIASGMAFQAMPFLSTYAASKAFLLHWSQGVHAELRGTQLRMVAICPGTIHTAFAETASVPIDDILGVHLVTGSVEDVAQSTLTAIRTNQATVVPGFMHRLVQLLNRWSPSWLVHRLTAWTMRRAYHKGATD